MDSPAYQPAAPAAEGASLATPAVGPDRMAARPSLSELFASEEAPLLNFALGLVGRRSVSEELVQDAFLRLHQAWRDVENPRAWLYRSVRNLALNHLRDHRREQPLDGVDPTAGDELPAEDMARREAVGTVQLLVAELAPEDRALLRFKYHEGSSYQQISQRTGLSVGHVGYKLHHLLKGLADALRHAGIEGSQG
ncbi:MAG TPA: RNA polymerase sigma factor [Opitutaceae bacterium]|nr:RNA polymerase sigma factor [Opitutaceae bacterium]